MPRATPSVANLNGLEGDDALPTDGAGHRDRSDLGQRSIGTDVELVDDPVPTGLDVEVLPADGC